jgi:hypothetical protein
MLKQKGGGVKIQKRENNTKRIGRRKRKKSIDIT